MKAKNIFMLLYGLAVYLSAPALFAQSGKTVQGMLRDQESRVVAGASVELIGNKDTLGTSASQAGIFIFNAVKSDTFTIKVNSLGFEPFEKSFRFAEGQVRMQIPSFELQGIANMLEEVVINGVLSVQVKGDTIEYSTKDLKLREGALAEDALKRLQGVEVDKDGNVTAQGEQIARVRINGKDFFGGDVKTATQNLPANIIEKMQVIDDYGDMANLTGNKTGDSEKVLNIQIDPEYNKGQMGMLRLGYGTEDRFQTTGMWMGLTDKTQVSVMGNLNNMNANLFDFNTMGGGARRRMGGGGGRGGGNWGGSDGITKVGSIGLNLRHDFSDKLKVYGSYSFGRNDNSTQTESFTEYIGQDMGMDNNSDKHNIGTSHRLEANLEWNISDKDYIKISPQFGFNKSDQRNLDSSTFYLHDLLDYQQAQTQINGNNAPRYGISGLYNHRLNDKGRNFFIDFNYDNSVSEKDYNQILDRLIYDPNNQDENIGSIYEQTIREAQNKSWNAGSSLSYTEPLGEKSRLELTYDLNINDYDNFDKQHGFDKDGQPLDNSSNSEGAVLNYDYDYDYSFTSHRIGANYSFDNDKIKYSIGAAVQPTVLSGNAYNASQQALIDQKNFNIVPIARFEYKFSKQANISFNYSGRASEPGVSQILPFDVSTNRTSTVIGNPDLNPSFQHSGRIRFRNSDFQKGKTFFATLSADLTTHNIVSFNKRYSVEGDGIYQEVRYLNASDPVYSINGFYHYGRSLKDKTYNIMYMGMARYNRNISYISQDPNASEGDKNVTSNTILMQGLSFRYTPSENLEISPGIRYTYNITNSSLPQYSQGNVSSLAPTLNGSVNITKTTIFGADLSKTFNKGYRTQADPFIVNTYLEQRMFKGQRGTLRLQAFDLLNQQTNINRTVGDILTDSRTNRLGRYFMLTFTFRFQKFSGINPFSSSSEGPHRRH